MNQRRNLQGIVISLEPLIEDTERVIASARTEIERVERAIARAGSWSEAEQYRTKLEHQKARLEAGEKQVAEYRAQIERCYAALGKTRGFAA